MERKFEKDCQGNPKDSTSRCYWWRSNAAVQFDLRLVEFMSILAVAKM